MNVLGADTHKRSHTIAGVEMATGQALGDKTVGVAARGFSALLIWARALDRERVWALEGAISDRPRRAARSWQPAAAASRAAPERSR